MKIAWVTLITAIAASLSACKTPAPSNSPVNSINPDTVMNAQYQEITPVFTWTTAGDSKAVFSIQACELKQPCQTLYNVDCSSGVCNTTTGTGAAVAGPVIAVQYTTNNEKQFTMQICNLANLAFPTSTTFQIISAKKPAS